MDIFLNCDTVLTTYHASSAWHVYLLVMATGGINAFPDNERSYTCSFMDGYVEIPSAIAY